MAKHAKTIKSAAKRFKMTASGAKHRKANRSHNLGDEPSKRKRQRGANVLVHKSDLKRVLRMLRRI